MKPSFMKSILIIPLSFFLITCDKDSADIQVKSLNFNGCDKSKSISSSTACTKFETYSSNYLKISRTGILLNCGVDSISVSIVNKGGEVTIIEQDHAKKVAFCNCIVSYNYIIGPLEKANYSIKIQGCKGELTEFNYTAGLPSVVVCQ